ncbi:MAG: hypothetical protein V4627_14330 [Pseudomonadota bacterium]
MMRQWMVALCLWGLSVAVWSQGDPGLAAGGVQSERARIDSQRQQRTTELDAEDAACLSRFAVTDCQNQVGVRRRQMLSDLKRQETSLNAAERQQKGEEQLQRGTDKAVENVQRKLDAQTTAEKNLLVDRQKAQDDKHRAHKEQAQPMRNTAPTAKSGSVLDAQTIEKNREAYLEKQKALEKRRKERDQRVLDHGKGGPPLPVP